uniref:Transmembrane protein n=1 Tax=Rhabditophanes sp. KR3021 TaxID=114890 RepID=A0AC35UH69_9BILA
MRVDLSGGDLNAPNVVRIAVLPAAALVGTIGVMLERKFRTPKKIEYLESSIVDQRAKRLASVDPSISQGTIPNTLSVNS